MIKRYKSGSRMSQAVTYNGFVFIAGQVADNRQGTLESQTREVLAKIEALLAEAGSDKSACWRWTCSCLPSAISTP